jgi:succinate dehydrogenase/fumarate reductase flavoprotein subunit
MDTNGKNVAAAIGFSTRENKIYSFKAKAMLCATAERQLLQAEVGR